MDRSTDVDSTAGDAGVVAWLDGLGRVDTATGGGKGANLGGLTGAGLPVPPGFVVTAAGYAPQAPSDDAGFAERLVRFGSTRSR